MTALDNLLGEVVCPERVAGGTTTSHSTRLSELTPASSRGKGEQR